MTRAQFTATFDELVDASVRAHLHATKTKPSPWWSVAAVAAGAALAAYAVSGEATSMWIALPLGVIFAVLWCWPVRPKFRRYLQGVIHDQKPFDVLVELTPEGVSVKQLQVTTIYAWPIVESIEETADSLDFHIRNANIIVVRNRAFATAEARQQFIALAEQYRTAPKPQ